MQGQDRAIYVNTRVFGPQDSAITIDNAGKLEGRGTFSDPTIRLLNDGADIKITNEASGWIQALPQPGLTPTARPMRTSSAPTATTSASLAMPT